MADVDEEDRCRRRPLFAVFDDQICFRQPEFVCPVRDLGVPQGRLKINRIHTIPEPIRPPVRRRLVAAPAELRPVPARPRPPQVPEDLVQRPAPDALLTACTQPAPAARPLGRPDVAPRLELRNEVLERVVFVGQPVLRIQFAHPFERLLYVSAGVRGQLEEQVAELLEPRAAVPVWPVFVEAVAAHGVKVVR